MVAFTWTKRSTKLCLLGINTILIASVGIYIFRIGSAITRQYQLPSISEAITLPASPPPAPAFTFPSGGTTLLPEHRLIAIYGTPGIPALGALGEQDISSSIDRVKKLTAEYQTRMDEIALPTFEIITTIASASATDNGDYSQEVEIAKIKPWIKEAKKAGIYVLLDLQPGRTDFLTQAKQYEELLVQPHVGLALDPEWRIKPNQVHLRQIGSVDAKEINAVSAWLSGLIVQNNLPQKLLLLHQFKLSMISRRESVNTAHPELALLIQMDGLGMPAVKRDTWNVLTNDTPDNLLFGWKNFYVKDTPMMSDKETMAVRPAPWYVSYQ